MKKLSTGPAPTVTDRVFDSLYQAITQMELCPGDKLSEAEIADQLGVSRQPVRDAFFRLSQRGYLTIQPQRATRVSRISTAQVLDAMFIRNALEQACIAQISDLDTAKIAVLRNMLEQQNRALEEKDSISFHVLDEGFHQHLCALAGRNHVWSLILEQKGHLDRVRCLADGLHHQSAYEDHIRIVEALASGQTETAQNALEVHLAKMRQVLPQICQSNPAFFD